MAYVGTLQVLKAFDPGKWSICIFFEDVAPEGDDIKQPPPSAPMQPDSTLPGPDPGHGHPIFLVLRLRQMSRMTLRMMSY